MSRLEELIEKLCPNGVEYKAVGEVAEIRSGWGFPNQEQGLTEGDLPFYKVGDMNHPSNAVYMTIADNYISYETAKKLGCRPAPAGTIVFPKIGAAKGAKMPRGDKSAVMKYKFMLPSIEEQSEVVSILKKFEQLCTDLNGGLPAEIEARQKQYEYYRDKLLTFKRKEA